MNHKPSSIISHQPPQKERRKEQEKKQTQNTIVGVRPHDPIISNKYRQTTDPHATMKRFAVKEVFIAIYGLHVLIFQLAFRGQTLPLLSLFLVIHGSLHIVYFDDLLRSEIEGYTSVQFLSLTILVISAGINILGYALLVSLYKHCVKTIFNREIPETLLGCLPSFGVHLAMLRPLEACWRYTTARFRVLPDVIILGEVRCGTTTLCQHLSSLPGFKPPFCLWKHPELDKKETFYFVGHYLGMVDPFHYRMCFPLQITKWFHRAVLKRPFFTFDGCAQYLTSPTAPHLIAKAYRDAGQPPPILIACVRDPVDQAISWWNYENDAIQWGSSMGLHKWNTALRSTSYPPHSISEAIDFSKSDSVESAFRSAGELFDRSKPESRFILPPWAMSWPSGQLASIGRNGRFASNIRRYESVFGNFFSKKDTRTEASEKVPLSSTLNFVNVIPLSFLGDTSELVKALDSIVRQATQRNSVDPCHFKMSDYMSVCSVHRNASRKSKKTDLKDQERLKRLFKSDTNELENLCGMSFGWKTSPDLINNI